MVETAQSPQPSLLARHFDRIALLAFAVAVIGVVAEVGSGLSYRFGIVQLRTALLTILPVGVYIAAAGAALCLAVIVLAVILFRRAFLGRSVLVIAGLVAGGTASFIPYSMRYSDQPHPPIHDISTDLDNPPAFVEILQLRDDTGATNTASYLRENKRGDVVINVPEAQLKAYPDVKPIVLQGASAADAYKRALAAVQAEGWTIVAAKPDEGRIEAWDKTFWFGFVDDVVIRITEVDGGSKIDIRSLSRVGGGDVGKNAERIRGYTRTLLSIKG